jgi:hypothetical protein
MIESVHWSSCKVPSIIVRIKWNSNFLDRFSKFAQMSNIMKMCLVGAELFHGDGRTNMMEVIVAFCNFANAPNKEQFCIYWSYNSCTTVKITEVAVLHCLLQNTDMSKIFLYIKRVYTQCTAGCYWCCLQWDFHCRHNICSSIVLQIWTGSVDVKHAERPHGYS